MLVAGRVNLEETLAALAKRRRVFHSERDFQVALAWQVQIAGPDLNVYLETRPAEGVHLDLAIESADHEHYTAIELKYFTRRWLGRVGGQLFDLKAHGAHDLGGWGVVKDVKRVEEFVQSRQGSNGAVIAVTNDPKYWTPTPLSTANDTAFRLGEGTVLEGLRRWLRPPADAKNGASFNLEGSYDLRWSDYSRFEPDGHLRQLVIEIPGPTR